MEKCSNDTSKKRNFHQNLKPITSFNKDDDLIQLQYTPNILITTETPLKPITADVDSVKNMNLPNIYPLKHTVTIPKEHFYDFDTSYRKLSFNFFG